MHPIAFSINGVDVASYALLIGIGAVVALLIRRVEVKRLGYQRTPGHQWVGIGALVGGVIGAKVGMVLFQPDTWIAGITERAWDFDLSGKTIVGGLIGGYAGVELTKKAVGVKHSTGDAFAVALPIAQAFGRVGCLLGGCCWGTPADVPWSVTLQDAARHPAQLYEAVGLIALAAWLWRIRTRDLPRGHVFRRYLVGYAAIRFVVQFVRGDPVVQLGPLDAVQWVCLVLGGWLAWLTWSKEQRQTPPTALAPT